MPPNSSAPPPPDRALILRSRLILYNLMLRQRQRAGEHEGEIGSLRLRLRIARTEIALLELETQRLIERLNGGT